MITPITCSFPTAIWAAFSVALLSISQYGLNRTFSSLRVMLRRVSGSPSIRSGDRMIVVRLAHLNPIYTLGLNQILRARTNLLVIDSEQSYGQTSATVSIIGYANFASELRIIAETMVARSVLVVLHGDDPDVAERCFAAGAIGCVASSMPGQTIVEAVETVADGRRFVALGNGSAAIRAAATSVQTAGPVGQQLEDPQQTLSPREHEVLAQIATGRTHDQIARLLGISRHTVDTYIKRARKKLQLGNKAELTRAAIFHTTAAAD